MRFSDFRLLGSFCSGNVTRSIDFNIFTRFVEHVLITIAFKNFAAPGDVEEKVMSFFDIFEEDGRVSFTLSDDGADRQKLHRITH